MESLSNIGDCNSPQYSVFSQEEPTYKIMGKEGIRYATDGLLYRLWIPDTDKKGKPKPQWIAYIQFNSVSDTRRSYNPIDYIQYPFKTNITYRYQSGRYLTFLPGIFTYYIKSMNDFLQSGEKGLFTKSHLITRHDLSGLRTDTLYMPDYYLYHNEARQVKTNDEKIQNRMEDFLKECPYPVRFVPIEEYSKAVLNKNPKAYFFQPVTDRADKTDVVFDNISFEPVYTKNYSFFFTAASMGAAP